METVDSYSKGVVSTIYAGSSGSHCSSACGCLSIDQLKREQVSEGRLENHVGHFHQLDFLNYGIPLDVPVTFN